MNERKKGALLSYTGLLLTNILNILLIPVIIYFTGEGDYGLYSLIGSFVGYLTILDFGIGNTIIRYIAEYKTKKDKVAEENFIGICLIIYAVITFIVIILGIGMNYNIEKIFGNFSSDELQKARSMMILLIINIGFTLPGHTFSSIIIAYEKFTFSKMLNIIKMVARSIVVVAGLMSGLGIIYIVLIDTIFNIGYIIINVYYVFKRIKVRIRIYQFSKKFIWEIFSYSIFIFITMIVDQLYWKIDQSIVGIMIGPIASGFYAISSQIIMGYMGIATSMSSLFFPELVKMVTENETIEKITELAIKVSRFQFIVLAYFLGAFIILGNQFIYLWFGKTYQEVYIMIIIVIIPLTIVLIQNLMTYILQAYKLHSFRAITYLFIAISNIILSIYLVNKIGIIGCAVGTAVALIIGNIMIMNIYYRVKVKIDILKFFTSVLNRVGMSFILVLGISKFLYIEAVQWSSFVINGIIYTMIYICVIYTIGMSKNEKNTINQLLKSIFVLTSLK